MLGLFKAWFGGPKERSEERARRLILAGKAPAGMRVDGTLRLRSEPSLRRLPPNLKVPRLELIRCENLQWLPPGLQTVDLDASGCSRLRRMPEGLRCRSMILRQTAIETLPRVEVAELLDLSGCQSLHWLPARLSVDRLILSDCSALQELPSQLDVRRLDIRGCEQLIELPAGLNRIERLNASGCSRLASLPADLPRLTHLDVSGCSALSELPPELQVRTAIDVAGSGLTGLPASCRQAAVYWRGVPISDRIAFSPETITVQEILRERNVELRRVLLERVGLEWFVERAQAEELDADRDKGGPRRLLRIPLDGEADLVCVVVRCPSTGRQYILRVPPRMQTCRQAVAWTAGYEDPDEYQPLVET